MGYLKNKTFGFYLSFVAAILALIGFVMYRQSGHTESYIEVLLLVTVVQIGRAHGLNSSHIEESRMPSSA